MNTYPIQRRTFDLERAGTRLTEMIAAQVAAKPNAQATIPVELEDAETRLYDEIGRMKRRFADLEATVQEIKRCRGSLATTPKVGRLVGKHA
jgi:hypothetical protein